MLPEGLCGSRHLAIGKPQAQTELSTAAYSRSEARAVPDGNKSAGCNQQSINSSERRLTWLIFMI